MTGVSIIVPVYNADKYIERWYNNMCHQELDDYEIIFIDDGSTDTTIDICQSIVKNDKRYRLLRTNNQGAGAARNLGIEYAQGAYIGFSDIDDTYDNSMYKKLYKEAINKKADVVKCGFDTIESGSNRVTSIVLPEAGFYTREAFLDNLVLGNGDGAVWNLLIRADIARSVKFPVGQIMEDIVYCANLSTKISYVYGIQEPLYHYWQNISSVMHKDMDKRLYDTGLAHIKISEYAKSIGCLNACGAAFLVVLQAYLNLKIKIPNSTVTDSQLDLLWTWLKEHKLWFCYETRMNKLKKIYYNIPFINRFVFFRLKGLIDKDK